MPGPSRSTLVASIAIAVIVLVLGLRWLGREEGAPVAGAGEGEAAAHTASGAPGGAASDPGAGGRGDARNRAKGGARDEAVLERQPAAALVVHVVGAVHRPGVYRLRDGARVADAVERAGGAAHGADQAALNLAAKLVDGQQVLLPRRGAAPAGAPRALAAPGGSSSPGGTSPGGESPGGAASPGAQAGPISLASATLEQLDTLDGVGPVTAQKILDWRAKSGGFASVDDLAQIPGIGPKKLESLRAQVVP